MNTSSKGRDRLSVSLAGFKRGSRSFLVEVPSASISEFPVEFKDVVVIEGTVHHLDTKFYVEANIFAVATLECDRSLQEYKEEITAELALEFEFNSELAKQQKEAIPDGEELRGLFEEANEIDLTDDVRQELTLALPMKRTAPQFRDLPFEDIHPDSIGDSAAPEGLWEALRTIKKK